MNANLPKQPLNHRRAAVSSSKTPKFLLMLVNTLLCSCMLACFLCADRGLALSDTATNRVTPSATTAIVHQVGQAKTPVVVLDNVLPDSTFASIRDALRRRSDFENASSFPGKIASLNWTSVAPLMHALASSAEVAGMFPRSMFENRLEHLRGFASVLCRSGEVHNEFLGSDFREKVAPAAVFYFGFSGASLLSSLTKENTTGTAFYRERESRLERLSQMPGNQSNAAFCTKFPASIICNSNLHASRSHGAAGTSYLIKSSYVQTFRIAAVPNRMVVYPTDLINNQWAGSVVDGRRLPCSGKDGHLAISLYFLSSPADRRFVDAIVDSVGYISIDGARQMFRRSDGSRSRIRMIRNTTRAPMHKSQHDVDRNASRSSVTGGGAGHHPQMPVVRRLLISMRRTTHRKSTEDVFLSSEDANTFLKLANTREFTYLHGVRGRRRLWCSEECEEEKDEEAIKRGCSAGKYFSKRACHNCASGEYQSSSGQTSCSTCSGGKISGSGSANCNACTAGQYKWSGSSCTSCKSGRYQGSSGSTSCNGCSSGQASSSSGASSCTSCSPGQYSSGTGNSWCSNCAAGNYQGSSGAASCNACSPGQYQGSSGASSCTRCSPGQYSSGYQNSGCSLCSPGRYAHYNGQASCDYCAAGTESHASLTYCVDCSLGKFRHGTYDNNNCLNCGAGKYQPVYRQNFCLLCEIGRYAPNQGTQLACSDCTLGKYTNYKGASQCTNCEKGKYMNTSGATRCDLCEIGFMQNDPGKDYCNACPPGMPCAKPGAPAEGAELVGCEEGSYAYVDPTGITTCYDCLAGKFQNEKGKQTCKSCPAGQFTTSVGETSCKLCPAGFAQPQPGITLCLLCAPGLFMPGQGALVCKECANMFEATTQGQLACTPCLPGKHTFGLNGSAGCTRSCGPGKYVDGAGTCADCDPGLFQEGTNQISCKNCPTGFDQIDEAQAFCPKCIPGQYQATPGQAKCKKCEVGRFTPMQNQSVPCMFCPTGWANTKIGQVACLPCIVGYYTDQEEQQTCKTCPENWFTDEKAKNNCTVCPSGWIAPRGSAACFACSRGTYASVTDGPTFTNNCTSCRVGQYQDRIGQATCVNCAIGMMQDRTGQPFCIDCVPGKTQVVRGQTSCEPCELHYYAPHSGEKACSPCSTGSQAAVTGSNFCTRCAVGQYGLGAGLPCATCPRGRYREGEDTVLLAGCHACPAGYFQSNAGEGNCVVCPTGTANDLSGKWFCPRCAALSFTDVTTSILCIGCPSGYENRVAGSTFCTKCPVYVTLCFCFEDELFFKYFLVFAQNAENSPCPKFLSRFIVI